MALVGFSSLNVLLRYYASPGVLFAALSPYAALILWVCGGLAARYAGTGDWLRLLTPAVTLGVYAVLVWPTRNKLMEAWLRLLQARAEAHQGWMAAERASRAKSEFLTTVSHEIRTPLNGILGMAQALQADTAVARHRSQLQVIRGCGETLLGVLDDVLDLSKIEADKLSIEQRAFDMEFVTRGAVATFGRLAERKGVALDFSIDDAARGTFAGDPVRLRQILYNLTSNAVKFTDQGRVAVGVSYAAGTLCLEVADSGVGIAADRMDSVFEKFVQADGSLTRRVGGAGLGLTIARELAELMGGAIRASSVEGRGSVFTVSVPMERLSGPQPLRDPSTEIREVAASLSAIRILAAEDNEVNRLVLSALLSHGELSLTLVENGAQAVEAWRAADWDVILMDVQMPVMDGVTAAREIRAAEAATGRPRTPIVAVTANVLPGQRADYEAAGMGLLVAKPIDAAELFKAIEAALQGDRRATEAA